MAGGCSPLRESSAIVRPPTVALSVVFATALVSLEALAQTPQGQPATPLPPPPGAVAAPIETAPPASPALLEVLRAPMPEGQRASLDHGMRTLLLGRPSDAVVALDRLVRREGIDPRSYDPAAVALRLATSVARGTAETLALPPPAASGAPEGPLPPPPGDLDVLLRTIEGAMELAARRQVAAGVALVDSAVTGREAFGAAYTTVGILRGYFHSVPAQPAGGLGLAASANSVPTGSLSVAGGRVPEGAGVVPQSYERPLGTMDGAEAVTLYGVAGTFGLVTGIWAGLSIDGSDSGVARVTLPLLGLGGGIVAAAVIDRNHGVRRGRAYAANAGFWLGLLASGTLALANDWEVGERDNTGGHAMMAGSALGLGVGMLIGSLSDSLPGSGSYVFSGGAWGWFLGGALGVATEARNEGVATFALIGELVGVGAAMASASALRPTPSQARWLDAGAALGALLGFSLATATEDDSTRGIAVLLSTLVGGGLGLYFGRPSDADRELYRRRVADRGLSPRFSLLPVRGGGVLQVGL